MSKPKAPSIDLTLEQLLEGCRQFIFDAFDKHGYDLHEDGCNETDDCSCPRIKQANDLLRGWVAK